MNLFYYQLQYLHSRRIPELYKAVEMAHFRDGALITCTGCFFKASFNHFSADEKLCKQRMACTVVMRPIGK